MASNEAKTPDPEIVPIHSRDFAGIYLGESVDQLRSRFYLVAMPADGRFSRFRVRTNEVDVIWEPIVHLLRGRVVSIRLYETCQSESAALKRFEQIRSHYDVLQEYRDYVDVSYSFRTSIDGQRVMVALDFRRFPGGQTRLYLGYGYAATLSGAQQESLPDAQESGEDADNSSGDSPDRGQQDDGPGGQS